MQYQCLLYKYSIMDLVILIRYIYIMGFCMTLMKNPKNVWETLKNFGYPTNNKGGCESRLMIHSRLVTQFRSALPIR